MRYFFSFSQLSAIFALFRLQFCDVDLPYVSHRCVRYINTHVNGRNRFSADLINFLFLFCNFIDFNASLLADCKIKLPFISIFLFFSPNVSKEWRNPIGWQFLRQKNLDIKIRFLFSNKNTRTHSAWITANSTWVNRFSRSGNFLQTQSHFFAIVFLLVAIIKISKQNKVETNSMSMTTATIIKFQRLKSLFHITIKFIVYVFYLFDQNKINRFWFCQLRSYISEYDLFFWSRIYD